MCAVLLHWAFISLAFHTMLLDQSFMSGSEKEDKHRYTRQVCKLKESMFGEKGREQTLMNYGDDGRGKTSQRAKRAKSHQPIGDGGTWIGAQWVTSNFK